MNKRMRIGWLYGALALLSTWCAAYAGQCAVRSPAHRVALVELYSSEGCNSCPPADRWLSRSDGAEAAGAVVPLALHVDYWDSLGWKDRFAQHAFTERQRTLADYGASSVVYTPEVFVAGREMREWREPERFDTLVRDIDAQPASADVAIELTHDGAGKLQVDAGFMAAAGAARSRSLDAYVAVYENDLESHVRAGENSGVTLHHDHVVRQWLGPVRLTAGAARIHQALSLAEPPPDGHRASGAVDTGAGATRGRFGVAAFVEDATTGEVLQVANLPVCGQ
jgi:hypothetical protein